MAVLRRAPLDAAITVVIAATVVMFAFGTSLEPGLMRVGTKGRWVLLFALALLALARLATRPRRVSPWSPTWAIAAVLVLVGAESALWSVRPHATVGRVFTLGVLFVAAAALALSGPDPGVAARRTLASVLAGVAVVALGGLVLVLVDHRTAVLPASAAGGWRFRGLGQSPDTDPMLFAVGLPIALWVAVDHRGWTRRLGAALVLLFAGEIAASGSRGGLIAAFGGGVVAALALGRSRRARLGLAAAVACLGGLAVGASRLPSPAAAKPAAVHAQAPQPRHRGIDAAQAFPLESEYGYPTGPYQPPSRRTLFGSSGRIQAWAGAFDQGLDRPVVGYGFGTENDVFVDRFFTFNGSFVENSFIGFFLQLGAVGVALLVGLIVALAWSGIAAAWRSRAVGAGAAGAALGVLASAVLGGMAQSGLLSVGYVAATSIWLCVLTLPMLARAGAAT
jgi:O-antigen ligase